MTVVMITHYMDEAVDTDRCIVMESGKNNSRRKAVGGFCKKRHNQKNRADPAHNLYPDRGAFGTGNKVVGRSLDESGMVEALSKLLK